MELSAAIAERQSVRNFEPDPIDDETIRELISLAALAPSPNNAQPWRFIALANRELLAQMKAEVLEVVDTLPLDTTSEEGRLAKKKVTHFATFFADAPLVVAVLLEPYRAVVQAALGPASPSPEAVNVLRGQPDLQSVGAAVQNLLLAATDRGLGGCWLSGPLIAREGLERVLGVEAPWQLATLVALGKPVTPLPLRAPRKGLGALLEIRR
jgi:F420 biosynthesis protein FbiB-like protein